MKISFYLHAWQGVLMFLAGLICVLASFGGYLLSGGGEELLRRALLNVTSGNASYQSLEVNWRKGRIEVTNIRHEDFSWPREHPIAHLKNLAAPKLIVQLEGWPARVESITVVGLSGAAIHVNEGFLQERKLPDSKPPKNLPRIRFEDCDVSVGVGEMAPLKLSGCEGELSRDAQENLRARFSLNKLNDKPFDFTVETLENGRWVLTGNKIELDTRGALNAVKNPFAAKFDPVGLLIKALFSGEMGAEGTLTSLHIAVQPATERRAFSCEGQVGYSNLSLRLPPAAEKTGEALPFLLDILLGVDEKRGENIWPRWMQVDQIKTGANGRVAFHMADGRLDFTSDEGPGSAFIGVRGGVKFPPLESLKGSVEADASGSPRRILLRGFLGDLLSFETRVERAADRARTYELLVEPRPGGAAQLEFRRPLWRFESRVKDYSSVLQRPSDLPLAEFEVEGNARNFPRTEWLPPGLTTLAGRLHIKGGLYNLNGDPKDGYLLWVEKMRLDDGARIVYGGPGQRIPGPDCHPFWEACYAFLAPEKPWSLYDLAMQGDAEVVFNPDWQWKRIALNGWTVSSGALAHEGLLTNIALPDLKLGGECERKPGAAGEGVKSANFYVKGSDWETALKGEWTHDTGVPAGGQFTLREQNVPLALHPLREALKKTAAETLGRVTRESSAQVKPDGVKVEVKGP